MQTAGSNPRITEDQYITPLLEILENTGPIPQRKPISSNESPIPTDAIHALFPEQNYEEKDIQNAKKILGEISAQFTTEQLSDVLTEIQYLTNSWLDDFERQIFDGITLKEVLHEKGAV